MNNNLEIDLILNRKKYPNIYNITTVITIIILMFIYIIFTYDYQSYYITKGKMLNNNLEIMIPISDLKYLENNHKLIIDKKTYSYKISKIDDNLYLDELYNNYKNITLKVSNLTNIDNFVYEIKIPKEKKKLAKYLKEYF